MQPISEIIKEIVFPIWLCWGIAAFLILMYIIAAMNQQEHNSWLSILPIQGLVVFLLSVVLILYASNSSLKRKKENEKKIAVWQGELLAVKRSSLLQQNQATLLDPRLQSVEGIIGYLDQSIKMECEPKNLSPILLFLAKEIKEIRDSQ